MPMALPSASACHASSSCSSLRALDDGNVVDVWATSFLFFREVAASCALSYAIPENLPLIRWLVEWLYLQPSRFQTTGRWYFSFNTEDFSVGDDVPVDSAVLAMTSSISRLEPPTRSLGGAHRRRVCVRAFIGVNVCACI